MCEVCNHHPCMPRCPNQEEGIIGSCHHCGEVLLDIYDGIYEDFEGNMYCDEDCAMKYYGIRERGLNDKSN